jgi:hypothetical protein
MVLSSSLLDRFNGYVRYIASITTYHDRYIEAGLHVISTYIHRWHNRAIANISCSFLWTYKLFTPLGSNKCYKYSSLYHMKDGTRWRSWLRHYATIRKVAGSIPDGVIGLFSLTYSFRPHYGPGVDSASNRNEYQEYFLGVNAAGA